FALARGPRVRGRAEDPQIRLPEDRRASPLHVREHALSLVGSHVNIPLYAMRVERPLPPQSITMFGRTYVVPPVHEEGMTIIAINVGGALVPVMLSLYLFLRSRVRGRMLLGVAVVAAIVHSLARIVPGAGIAVLMFVPPLAAAAVGVVLAFRRAPPVAYVSGSMGALIGADLLNLPRPGSARFAGASPARSAATR